MEFWPRAESGILILKVARDELKIYMYEGGEEGRYRDDQSRAWKKYFDGRDLRMVETVHVWRMGFGDR